MQNLGKNEENKGIRVSVYASVMINQPIHGQKLHILNYFFCAVPKLVGLPEINYSGLRWLCKTEGLGDRYALFPHIFVKAKDSILKRSRRNKVTLIP